MNNDGCAQVYTLHEDKTVCTRIFPENWRTNMRHLDTDLFIYLSIFNSPDNCISQTN